MIAASVAGESLELPCVAMLMDSLTRDGSTHRTIFDTVTLRYRIHDQRLVESRDSDGIVPHDFKFVQVSNLANDKP